MSAVTQCVHSGLDLFETPGLQMSVQHGEYVEYRPLATLDAGPVEFQIKGGVEYLDLANTFIQVKAKVVQPDGSDLQAGTDVVPMNLTLHSMFSDVAVFLNTVQITSPSGAYPYQAYIQTLLSYSPEVKASQLEAAMYHADSSGHFQAVAGQDNAGMVRRKARAAGSAVLDMMGRLYSDLFHQGKYLLSHLDVRIKLTRSKDAFVLSCAEVAGARPPYKLHLLDASLFVRKVTVSPAVALAHAKTLDRANVIYPLTKTVMRVFTAARGSFSFQEDNLFLDRVPNRVIIGFVKAAAYNGSYQFNPFEFEHVNLNFLSLYHQGQQIPGKGLRPNFETGEYTQAYMTLFTGTNSAWTDVTSGVKLADYAGGYTLFCFDLTPSLAHTHAAFEVSRAGPLRVQCEFSTALEQPMNVLIYAEITGHLEVTKTREIISL